MRLHPRQGSFTVLATFLVLAISFDSSPSLPSPPRAGDEKGGAGRHMWPAPDPQAIALVDELRGRATGREPGETNLQVLRPEDLERALLSGANRPHGLELFDTSRERGAALEVMKKLPFGRAIARAAERHRVDPLLLAAIVETESAFAPDAVSSEGAIGLMQLIPETGELYGRTDLFDPYVNLEVGSRYIGALIERYHGDLALALAAYNCGPATVTRYGRVPPFPETRDFVKSVLALYVSHRQSAWKREQESAGLGHVMVAERSLVSRDRRSAARAPMSLSPSPVSPAAPFSDNATRVGR
jgi:transglycosylase-like protein with SLT domain